VKIHEKEYEFLPEAWLKLHDAKDYISFLVYPVQTHPDFKYLKDDDIRESLKKNYKWSDEQIAKLIKASDRDKFFKEADFCQRSDETQNKIVDFHRYIIRNSIFMSQELKEQFSKADDLMRKSFVARKVGQEYKDFERIQESYEKLDNNIDNIIDAIEELVQKRLRYDEAL